MSVGSGGRGVALWIFIHDTELQIKQGGLMMLFFGLVFSVDSTPGNFSADALDYDR